MTTPRPTRALLLAIPLLLAAAAYGRVLHGEFVFDDVQSVQENRALHDPLGVLRGFGDGLVNGGRPTTEVTYAVGQALLGTAPAGFHVTSLLLHLAVTLLVFAFTRAVLRMAGSAAAPGVAVVVAGLFALHPLQSQAVSYVTQRAEVLASGFYLATLLTLLRADRLGAGLRGGLAAALALLLFVLGMGAKAIVVTVPVAWLLLLALVPPMATPGKRGAKGGAGGTGQAPNPWPWRFGVAALLGAVGIWLTRGAVRSVEGRIDAGFSIPRSDPGSYFLTQWRAVVTYLRLLAWPAGQNVDWSFPLSRSVAEPSVLLSGLLLAGLLAGGAVLWWRSRRGVDAPAGEARAAAFGVGWFFLLLAPTSSFFPIADVLVEHRVYLASWGILLAATLAGRRLLEKVTPGRRALAAAVAVGVAWGALALVLHRRNAVWESDLALWSDSVEKAPGKARPHLGLGVARSRRGDQAGAISEFQSGLTLAPADAIGLRVALLFNLGNALMRAGRPAEAVAPLRAAAEIDPSGLEAPQSLALALWSAGETAEAEAVAAAVLAREPGAPLAASVRGQALFARGDDAGATPLLEQALRAQPADALLRYDLGAAYANTGRKGDACATWRSLLRMSAHPQVLEAARQGTAVLGCPP